MDHSSELDDAALAVAARDGDRQAFALLVTRHYDRLFGACVRATGDRLLAADAAQEAVVAALVGLDRLRQPDRFGSWLIGIGLNVCRRLLRSRAATWSMEAALPVDAVGGRDATGGRDSNGQGGHLDTARALDADPADLADAVRVAAAVQRAIATLPAGQRGAVVLFYLAGLTQAEVAEHLGTQVSAVKSRLHKARAALRAQLVDVWRDELAMPTEPDSAISVQVVDVRRVAGDNDTIDKHVLMLAGTDSDVLVPIWVGEVEATQIAFALEGIELPRPGPYQFAAALLRGLDGGLREVRINRLREMVFYAEAVLSNGAVIDARPSDALNLAVLLNAPITVDRSVLEELAGRALSVPADSADARTIAEQAKRALDELLSGLAESISAGKPPASGPRV